MGEKNVKRAMRQREEHWDFLWRPDPLSNTTALFIHVAGDRKNTVQTCYPECRLLLPEKLTGYITGKHVWTEAIISTMVACMPPVLVVNLFDDSYWYFSITRKYLGSTKDANLQAN